MSLGTIVWLASYPKSGNTWLRFLLAGYLDREGPGRIPVNELSFARMASLRSIFDEWAAVESSDLTPSEIADNRAELFRLVARSSPDRVFLKVHDSWSTDDAGRGQYPADVTHCVLYVVRNPLDVAVSLAHHLDVDLSRAAALVCSDHFELYGGDHSISLQVGQRVGSWAAHARSWIDMSALPVTVVRFEDLKLRPLDTLRSVITAIGESVDEARLSETIAATTFERLQAEERRLGFPERASRASAFFRGGRMGDGRRTLAADDARRIVEWNETEMRRFGYLDA